VSVTERLRASGIDPVTQPVIVVHVSAGNPFRRWPAEAFCRLLVRLAAADERRRIVVVSGPSEKDAARDIGARARAALGRQGLDVNPAGVIASHAIVDDVEVGLAELRALLDLAALFIGGDSGPLHVAGTSGVPIVGVYGPTLSLRSAPWRPSRFVTESVELAGLPCRPCHQRVCEPGDFRCLGWISPDDVAEAAERALQRAAEQG
jgi:ADP-heptose:LPS heptosyltransferase